MAKTIIHTLRTQKKLSIMRLAAETGLGVATISDLENGKVTDPRCSTIRALASVLGPEAALLGGESDS